MTRQLSPLALARVLPAAALAAALAGAPAFAATSPADDASPVAPPASIRPVAGVLLTGTVGDSLVYVTNPDGSIVQGSLAGRYEAFVGAEFPVDPNGLGLRVTAGLHTSSTFSGSGGSEHATSIPLEATLWYPLGDKVHMGAGVRYAMHTRFSGRGNKTTDGLNPTPSLVFGVGYSLMPHLLLDMRYVYERYERASGGDFEASHWGVGLTAIY